MNEVRNPLKQSIDSRSYEVGLVEYTISYRDRVQKANPHALLINGSLNMMLKLVFV